MSNIPINDPGAADSPEAIVAQLRAIRTKIPEYVQLTPKAVRALGSALRTDPQFVQAAINTVGASEAVQSAIGSTAAELQQRVEEVARWSAVADELRAILQGTSQAIRVRRHRLALTALQTYGISRQLARQPEHSALLPHVQGMRELNRFRRSRSVPQPQTPPAAPAAS